MIKRGLILAAALILLGAILPSCRPAEADDGKKSIVVTYSVLGSLVAELVGDQAEVTVSIPNGLDPHEWEPSAKDIEAINKADLVVRNGLDLEANLAKTLEAAQSSGVRFFTASDYITVRIVDEGEIAEAEHEHEAIHEEEETHEHHHEAGAPDPHLWLDPAGMKSIVTALAAELEDGLGLDVAGRAGELAGRLDELDGQIAAMLAAVPEADRKLVTGHQSMGYFADRYGFEVVGVIIPSLSTQAQVSAADLAALKEAIEASGVRALFTELGTSPAVAEAIGKETGVRVVELVTHALPEDGSYFTFMLELAGTIAGALE